MIPGARCLHITVLIRSRLGRTIARLCCMSGTMSPMSTSSSSRRILLFQFINLIASIASSISPWPSIWAIISNDNWSYWTKQWTTFKDCIYSLQLDDIIRKILTIAFAIAVPLADYAIIEWMSDFAYQMPISWWYFIIPGLLVFVLGLLTVSFQSLKAAKANPIGGLRKE